MDPFEKAAESFLNGLGMGSVAYEPDGNVPPDFLVDGRIAVEVRLLNQRLGNEGLEQEDIPLHQRIQKLASKLGPPINGISWGVYYRFSRPVERWKTLGPKVEAALTQYESIHAPSRHNEQVTKTFGLTLFRYPVPKATKFFIIGNADNDSGGSLIPLMDVNIAQSSIEKEGKVARVRHKYQQWWLVLVDGIGFSFDSLERELFSSQVSIKHTWDRLVVISSKNPTVFMDVPAAG